LYKIAIGILKGKATYFAGLSAIVFGSFIISVGILVALVLNYIPRFGLVFAILAFSITFVTAISVEVKAMTELFGIDLITALFVVWLSVTSLFVLFYAIAVLRSVAQLGISI